MRYFNLSLSSPQPPVGVRESWFDGFGGVRVSHKFGKEQRWRFSVRGDAGAGGSDLSWGATGLLSYQVKEWIRIDAGYKALGVDYRTGPGSGSSPDRFTYDVIYHGPVAGFEFHW